MTLSTFDRTAWTTDLLIDLLRDYSATHNLELASADEMLHDLMQDHPLDRSATTNKHIAWLERFIEVWNLTQEREDATKLSDMPLTSGDTDQALAVVWAALEQLDLNDADSDQLNTAMAWITEALNQ